MPKRILKAIWISICWWWRLPRWVKLGKIVIIASCILCIPVVEWFQERLVYRKIYSSYYEHFYESYHKQRIEDSQAKYYASYYADFYAKYYSSADFRANQSYNLPSANSYTIAYPNSSPVAALSINKQGLTLIKSYEGLSLEPYYDAGGKLTIGYGHLIKPGEFYTKITEVEAHALLQQDMKVAEAYVKRFVKVSLQPNQFAALVSLVYNVGPGNFRTSGLLEAVNQQDSDRITREFRRWDHVNGRKIKGLTRRRLEESNLFGS